MDIIREMNEGVSTQAHLHDIHYFVKLLIIILMLYSILATHYPHTT